MTRPARQEREPKPFDAKVTSRFIAGVRQTCGKKIWEWVLSEKLPGETNAKIAKLANVNRSNVGRWKSEGSLSMESLVVMMAALGFDFNNLPRRPSNEHLAVGGYARGTTFVLEEILGQKLDGMTAEEFCCIRSLHLKWGKWKRHRENVRRGSEGAEPELRAFCEGVAEEADRLFRSYLADVPETGYDKETLHSGRVRVRTPEKFQQLYKQWGKAWEQCRLAVYEYAWLRV